jgi:hypothetical protein
MYGDLLNQPAPGGAPPIGPPPQAAALGAGLGAPPKMPGVPPPPTGAGAMPTGDPSTDKKEAADNAVMSLREVKGHYPSLGAQVDTMIDQIKSVAKAAGTKSPGLGEPAKPGADATTVPSPSSVSGGVGGF